MLCVFGCSKKAAPPEPVKETGVQHEKRPRPSALARTGAAPLWIEFDGENLRPIASPEAAELKPFVPWPAAEYAAGIVQWGDFLAVAVNCGGIWLVKEASDGLFELYFLRETEFTPLYTMLKAFTFQDKPVFLLYRNDFFVEHDIPPPSLRCFTVKDDISGLETVNVPAFSGFSGPDGWNIEDFFAADDGSRYFKAVKKNGETGKIEYVRTESLYDKGESITFGAYMRAAMKAAGGEKDGETPDAVPETPAGLPPLPENFVYTAYSRTGGAALAAWEERDNWNIGAAGLLLVQMPPGASAY